MRNLLDPSTEKPLAGLEGFYEEFLTTRLAELEELAQSLKVSDWKSVMELAHKWKGFSAPYGFGQLGHLAAELEESARHGKADQCQALYSEIVEYLGTKKK